MTPILHITTREAWETAAAGHNYLGDTLASEGFIHCSAPDQITAVANHFYKGQKGLVLLVIDPNRLTAPLVYEDLYDAGQTFPHIYGPLNLNAVTAVLDFPPLADGCFALPGVLADT